MGCEDNIVRTTVYLTKLNKHRVDQEKKQNKNFSLSGFLDNQLTEYFYGDEYELQSQIKKIDNQIDEIDKKQKALFSRKTDLQNRLENYENKQKKEKELYQRFINNCNGRIKQTDQYNIAPDYKKIVSHFHRSFFPDNNLNVGKVKHILHMVKTDKMNFETFKELRNGEFSGN